MTHPVTPIDRLARSLGEARDVIATVREDQHRLPTPCRSWDVGALLVHLTDDLSGFGAQAAGFAGGAVPSVSAGGGIEPQFAAGADALLDTWSRVDLSEPKARFILDQQTCEFAVHAWDLVRATGGSVMRLDAGLAEYCLAWAEAAMRPEFRGDESEGKAFGPQVPTTMEDPAADRLAAFFGRSPERWTVR